MTRRSSTRRGSSAATPLPVSADLEDGFARRAGGGRRDRRARAATTGSRAARSRTARGDARAARSRTADSRSSGSRRRSRRRTPGRRAWCSPARAENHIRGVDDLADTIARLQAYEQAGADVLFAPGLRTIEQIRAVVASGGAARERAPAARLPVGAGARGGRASRASSVGGAFAFAAIAVVVEAARELREEGDARATGAATVGSRAARAAFSPGGAETDRRPRRRRASAPCARVDSNHHGGNPPQGPQPCASTNSATSASVAVSIQGAGLAGPSAGP